MSDTVPRQAPSVLAVGSICLLAIGKDIGGYVALGAAIIPGVDTLTGAVCQRKRQLAQRSGQKKIPEEQNGEAHLELRTLTGG